MGTSAPINFLLLSQSWSPQVSQRHNFFSDYQTR